MKIALVFSSYTGISWLDDKGEE